MKNRRRISLNFYSFVSISIIAALFYQSTSLTVFNSSVVSTISTSLSSLVTTIKGLTSDKPKPEKVELKDQRTENSKTYLNPNGTYTTEISQQPINYEDDGQLKPIDTSLAKDTDGYKVDKNSLQVDFDNKSSNLLQITNPEDNTSINYKVSDSDKAQITPIKKSDNELSYDNYKDGASLNYKVQAGRLKEEIVLDKPPADNTFTFELDLKGLKPKTQKDGSIFLLDPKRNNKEINPKERNKPSFIIEAPFMSDSTPQDQNNPSTNTSNDVKMEIKQQKNDSIYESSIYTLKVTADKKWLEDPKRVYPVKIDPTFRVQQQAYLDTYLSSDLNWQYIRAGEDRMFAGSNDNGWGKGWPEHRALVRFDTSFIPKDATVSSANFYITQADPTPYKDYNYVTPDKTWTTIYRITSDWDKNITWNSMANNFATPWIGEPQVNTIEGQKFDVTGMVRSWQQNPSQNYGFMLLSNPGYFVSFWTYEANVGDQYKPRLEVTYQLNRIGRESYRTYKDYSGVSVDVQTGNAIIEATDVNIAGRGPATRISHIYNSQDGSPLALRQGFHLSNELLKVSYNGTSTAEVTTETGARHTYTLNADGTTFTRPPGVSEDLVIEAGALTLKRKDNSKIMFDTNGRISKEIDKNGNTLAYDYSTPSVIAIKDALDRITKLFYNPDGNIGKIVDFAGRITNFSYAWFANGNIGRVTITNPAGENTIYNYDPSGRLVYITNPNGKVTSILYDDAENKVTSITNPLSRKMTFSYTLTEVEASRNLLVNSSFEEGLNRWSYYGNLNQAIYNVPNPLFGSYFLETNIISPTTWQSWSQDYFAPINKDTPDTSSVYTFSVYVRSRSGQNITGSLTLWGLYGAGPNQNSNAGFSTSSTDWKRFSTTFRADQAYGALRAEIYLDTPGLINYDFDGAQLEKNAFASTFSDTYTAPKPREVSFTTATDPKGNKYTYYFNSEGLVSKMGEPIGPPTTTAADAPYFPEYTIAVPGQPDVDLDDFAEDEFADFEADAEADMGDAGSDAVDMITIPFQKGEVPKPEVSQPLKEGTVTQYQYDKDFNLKTIIEKDNTFITYTYDDKGNKLTETEHDHDYPENGAAATDAAKHRTTTYTYDANNNLTSQTSPTGKTTTYTYDANGNLLSESSPLVGEGQGEGVTSYTYDQYGNQLTKTDPEGNKTTLLGDYTATNIYDPATNNLKETVDPTGVSTFYTYDELGNKIAERKEGQDITGYSYDNLGRLVSQKSAANDKGFSINKLYYDAASNKTKDETYAINFETDQSSAWFNSAWQKRISLSIDNTNNAQALSDYQVKLTIPYIIGMNSDFSDLKFTDSDKITELPYWIESKSDSAQATVWIKVPSIAASSSKTIYMYFGNANAVSNSNGNNTFDFFDEFDGSSLDANKWNSEAGGDGSINVEDGQVRQRANNGWANISSKSANYSLSGNIIIDRKIQLNNLANGGYRQRFGLGGVSVPTDQGIFDNENAYFNGWSSSYVPVNTWLVMTQKVADSNYYWSMKNIFDFSSAATVSAPYVINSVVGDGNVYQSGDVITDWIRARKYTSVEPTVSFGTLKKWTSYNYDDASQLKSQANYMQDGTLYAQTDYEYNDANGNKTAEKKLQKYDALNNSVYSTTTYQYDELNRLIKETKPDKSWTAYKYDSFGNVVQEGTPEGTTANIYDKAKNQIATASSDKTVTKSIYDKEGNERIIGDGKDIASATNYDANGNIEKVADANNQKTNYSYDANQNEKTVTAPDNTTTTTNYNQANQVALEQDQNQQGTTNGTKTNYNNSGQESSVNQPNNQDQSMQYNNSSNLTDLTAAGTTANSADSTTSYDALGNPKTLTTDVAGTSQQALTKIDTTYDSADRITSTTDFNNVVINYCYDYLNNLTKLIEASSPLEGGCQTQSSSPLAGEGQGEGATYDYDTTSKLTSIKYNDQQVANFTYERGTLDGGVTFYEKSNIAKITLPNSVSTDFNYDPASKITNLTNKQGQNTLSSYNYAYDANGNITNTVEPDGSTIYSYDSLNRLTKTVNKDASIINYTYDEQGNRLKKEKQVVQNSILTTTETLSYSYSPANELLSAQSSLGSITTYGYDANGNTLNKLELSNNSLLATNYTYDNKNQLVKVKKIYPDSDSIPDNWTPIVMSAGDGRSTDYALEGTYSLKFAGDTTKQKHIKQDINISGNAGDLLTLSGSNKTIGASSTGGIIAAGIYLTNTDGTQSSSSMFFNKDTHDWTKKTVTMTAPKNYKSARVIIFYFKQTGTGYFDDFKLSKSGGNQLLKQPSFELDSDTIEYVYDGNGNRYSKTITPSGGTPSTRYYSYDTSGNIVSEYKRVILNGSEESQTLVRYVRDNTGKAISMIQGASTYYFIYNGHGDVTALTDSPPPSSGQAGTVAATYSYDEFGNITSETGNIYNPLRYSGANNAYYDSETALYKMGTRYYQPDIGRWLTRDSYTGEQQELQSRNRYIYVENNPVTYFDNTGNKKKNLNTKLIKYLFRVQLNDFSAGWHIQSAKLFHNVRYTNQQVSNNTAKMTAWGRKNILGTSNPWAHTPGKPNYSVKKSGAKADASGNVQIDSINRLTGNADYQNNYFIDHHFNASQSKSNFRIDVDMTRTFFLWQFEVAAWRSIGNDKKLRYHKKFSYTKFRDGSLEESIGN